MLGAYMLAIWLDMLGVIDLGEAPVAPELDDLSI
jgi:hypothetical protein